jgi:hypothetical protein
MSLSGSFSIPYIIEEKQKERKDGLRHASIDMTDGKHTNLHQHRF